MLSVALIGAGRIGQIHARNIAFHPDSQLTFVADINADAAKALAEKYNAQVAEVDAVLANPQVDVVVIASATNTHADLTEIACRNGKAVFCEKPIDLSIDRVRQCVSVVNEHKGTMMVGFNRRFDPNFAHLKRSLDAGDIGELELLTIHSRDPGAPPAEYLKVSGGMFRDMTIHDFDMALFLLGEDPVSVFAHAASLVDPAIKAVGDIDTAVVTLQCASGKMAVITNSRRAAYGYDQRVEAHGSKGMLNVNNILESSLVKSTADGVVSQKPQHFFLERYAESYVAEWAHFMDAMSEQKAPEPTAEDGQRALVLAEAAFKSLQTGQPVAPAW
ncbi:inositol 2-dehydrogenase [Gynuella sp.]|uniref:inositol 2-dehydrogenase n=1 Tax=Gynuella sp. TaxID=2969146 RepID=UPI003D0EEFC5